MFIMLHHKYGFGEKEELKKLKNLLIIFLLLFNFEKAYFDKEKMSSEFVGHPLLDETSRK